MRKGDGERLEDRRKSRGRILRDLIREEEKAKFGPAPVTSISNGVKDVYDISTDPPTF